MNWQAYLSIAIAFVVSCFILWDSHLKPRFKNMPRIRAVCDRKGHKFKDIAPGVIPYIFCHRWFCHGTAVSGSMPVTVDVAAQMHNAIPWEDRVPQTEVNHRGEPVERDPNKKRITDFVPCAYHPGVPADAVLRKDDDMIFVCNDCYLEAQGYKEKE